MLFLLLLSTSVSSQSLATPVASDIQALAEDHTIFGIVKAGTEHVFGFRLKNPSITYITVTLTTSYGDADLVISTRVGTTVVSWTSMNIPDDKLHIEATHPSLKADGKKLQRDWEVTVVGQTNAQYTLSIKLGSGTAVLATDLEQTYHKVTAFSMLRRELETSGSQGTTALTVVMVLVNLGVFAAAGVWALRRQKAVHDWDLHLVTVY
jgi:hypothetical protein